MIISHKIHLDPNNKQATYFAKAAGTARFAYNWALAEWQTQYAAWKNDHTQPKPSQFSLRKQLNAIKREQFPWMLDVTKNAPQMAIIQLGAAFNNFFAGRAKYPQFKKKGKILSATISRTADQWFASITVDIDHASATLSNHHLPPAENQGETLSLSKGTVGVDLGVSALATLSTGETVAGAKPHKALLSRAISDMGFFEFRRQLEYKAAMRGGIVVVADRFFASSKTCSTSVVGIKWTSCHCRYGNGLAPHVVETMIGM